MGKIGTTELLVVLAIVLVIFGPKALPKLGRSLGKTLGSFRKGMSDGADDDEDDDEEEVVVKKKKKKPVAKKADDEDDEDEDGEYDEDDEDAGVDFIEYECPHCHTSVYYDQEAFDLEEEHLCPECGRELFPNAPDEEE